PAVTGRAAPSDGTTTDSSSGPSASYVRNAGCGAPYTSRRVRDTATASRPASATGSRMPKKSPDPSSTPGGDQPNATMAPTALRSSRYAGGSIALLTAVAVRSPASSTLIRTAYFASPVPDAVGSSVRSSAVPAASRRRTAASVVAKSCQASRTLPFRSAPAAVSSSSSRSASAGGSPTP